MRIIESTMGVTNIGEVVLLALLLAVLTWTVRFGTQDRRRRLPPTPRQGGTNRRWMTTVRSWAWIFALMAIVVIAIGVGLLATPFAIIWRMARRPGRRPVLLDAAHVRPMPTAPTRTPSPSDSLASLTTAQLCRAWQSSYVAAVRAANPAVLDGIARTRGRYLDELERRDPVGFQRWIDSGARAASDPARHIRSDTDRASTPRDDTA